MSFGKSWKGKKFFLALFKTAFGSKLQYFTKWKALRPRFNQKKIDAAHDINDILAIIVHRYLKVGFEPLRDQFIQVQTIKLWAIKKLYDIAERKEKRGFRIWKDNTKNIKHMEICKDGFNIIDILRKVLMQDTNILFDDDKRREIKTRALR